MPLPEILSPRDEIAKLLADMTAIVNSSPDALETQYAALRDGSYNLAVQVRTAALPDPMARRDAFVTEATARKW